MLLDSILTIGIATSNNVVDSADLPRVQLVKGTNHATVETSFRNMTVLVVRDYRAAHAANQTNRIVLLQGTNRIVLQRTNGPVEVSFE